SRATGATPSTSSSCVRSSTPSASRGGPWVPPSASCRGYPPPGSPPSERRAPPTSHAIMLCPPYACCLSDALAPRGGVGAGGHGARARRATHQRPRRPPQRREHLPRAAGRHGGADLPSVRLPHDPAGAVVPLLSDANRRKRNLLIIAGFLFLIGVANLVDTDVYAPDLPIASNITIFALLN